MPSIGLFRGILNLYFDCGTDIWHQLAIELRRRRFQASQDDVDTVPNHMIRPMRIFASSATRYECGGECHCRISPETGGDMKDTLGRPNITQKLEYN